ncbi:multicopper oxidase family protein [Micromonospora sp. RTGN7]|uniref:multicopper oxidase family protein n=1 Tax=Micromonospora sp. RTGN7 TaxID=3016526 RepID=UPI0029FF1B93|nr:multicopper oxidase family protein [Micromonospora sp. RTGN7]
MPVLDLLSVDLFVVFFSVAGWLVASRSVAGLARVTDPARIRRRTTTALVAVVVSVAIVVLRVAVASALLSSGWWFVQETLVLGLPVQLVSAAAVLLLSMRPLVRLRRLAAQETAAATPAGPVPAAPATARPLSRELRSVAIHPLVVAPIRIALYSAVAAFLVLMVFGYPVSISDAVALLVPLVALGAFVTWRAAVRWGRVSDHGEAGPRAARGTWLRRLAAGLVVVLTGAGVVVLQNRSELPQEYSSERSAAARAHSDAGPDKVLSVAQLRGTPGGGPVRKFTMVTSHTTVRLPSGRSVAALAFNNSVPGPELRVTVGDTVEVTLRNTDVAEGVTIHWHGYPVPNGEDGVAGVTQDAVPPGGEFVYRFRATQPGTYWYHSHQRSNELVRRGLFGAFVVQPATGAAPDDVDLVVPVHSFDTEGSINPTVILRDRDQLERLRVRAGVKVRLRMINTDGVPRTVGLTGVSATISAADGMEINGPELVPNPSVEVAAGGRVDFVFAMPTDSVLVSVSGIEQVGLVLHTAEGGRSPATGPHRKVDLLSYGAPADTGITRGSDFDHTFTLVLDQKIAFYDGRFDTTYTVNGRTYPDIPPQLVDEGDLIKFVFVNRSIEPHPMHPHGSHVLVLARDGKPTTGAPIWLDSLNVAAGQTWEVAMRANNPGIWMDHCHNLRHAARGMMFHLAYRGVTSPYLAGHKHGNYPE